MAINARNNLGAFPCLKILFFQKARYVTPLSGNVIGYLRKLVDPGVSSERCARLWSWGTTENESAVLPDAVWPILSQ